MSFLKALHNAANSQPTRETRARRSVWSPRSVIGLICWLGLYIIPADNGVVSGYGYNFGKYHRKIKKYPFWIYRFLHRIPTLILVPPLFLRFLFRLEDHPEYSGHNDLSVPSTENMAEVSMSNNHVQKQNVDLNHGGDHKKNE